MLVFILALVAGEMMIFLQAYLAYRDGFLTRNQPRKSSSKKVAVFIEHAGMWGDAFIVTPTLAGALSKHYATWPCTSIIICFIVSLLVSSFMLRMWVQASKHIDESMARDGKVTATGRVHFAYTVIAITVVLLVYFGTPREMISKSFVSTMTLALAVHVVLGVIQPEWKTHGRISRSAIITTLSVWAVLAICWLRLVL